MKTKIFTITTLILLFLCSGVYYVVFYDPLPANVEIVVPKAEKPDGWLLSPNGDKIFYLPIVNGQYKPTLLFLNTQQKKVLEKCDISWWVNNTSLACQASENAPMFLVNIDDFSQLPVQIIQSDNPQLPIILQNAGKIYRYSKADQKIDSFERKITFFFVLSEDKNKPNENYQVYSTDITATLKSYNYTEVNILPLFSKYKYPINVPSPNQAYYMIWEGGLITIYDTKTHQQIVQYFANGANSIYVGGWAWDSSGVYFKGYELGIMSRPDSAFPILKLVIPKYD